MKTLSWKPVRKGRLYCAPACGRGCTKQEHNRAIYQARKLRDRMGKRWRINIWENMGWHYRVISPCGRIYLHPGYIAFLGEPNAGGGRYTFQHSHPERAVLGVIETAKRDLATIGAILKGL